MVERTIKDQGPCNAEAFLCALMQIYEVNAVGTRPAVSNAAGSCVGTTDPAANGQLYVTKRWRSRHVGVLNAKNEMSRDGEAMPICEPK